MELHYRFELKDEELRFTVGLDKTTGLARGALENPLPSWARLEVHQCPHCSLDPADYTHCPLAARVVPTVRPFKDLKSYERATVKVAVEERLYALNTTVQRGLGALLGLIMATSGCPHTRFLKPMARFHLPFASEEETLYRVVSMYLMREFILNKDKAVPPSLDGLKKLYANLEVVNKHVALRLREMTADDASVNALVILDFFAKSMPLIIEDELEDIPKLFL